MVYTAVSSVTLVSHVYNPDFRPRHGTAAKYTRNVITEGYRPPELDIAGESAFYTRSVDVFSVGIIFEVLLGLWSRVLLPMAIDTEDWEQYISLQIARSI